MAEFFNKIKENFLNIYNKLSKTAKIIIGAGVGVLVLFFILVAVLSGKESKVPLFPNGLSDRDFNEVVTHLANSDVEFTTADERYIYVENEEVARQWRTVLAMEGTIQDVPGYEIYGQEESYTRTDDERTKLYHAVLTTEIKRHIESLEDIDKAEVIISFPEKETLFIQDQIENPITAWINLTPAPYSDITENKKKILGLRNAIAMGVDRLEADKVTIIDAVTGENLTDMISEDDESEQIALAKYQTEHKMSLLAEHYRTLNNLLAPVFGEDRYRLEVNLELNWDQQESQRTERGPLVIQEDDPETPYYDGQVEPYFPISSEITTEEFRGPAFIPEGAPGTEFNVPPGMMQFVDQFTQYTSNTRIENNEVGSEEHIRSTKQPYEIEKFSIACILDGKWSKGEWNEEEQKFVREYTAVTNEELNKVEDLIKGYQGFEAARGDSVSVQHIAFDRTDEFSQEDQAYLESVKNRLFYLVLFSLLIAAIIIAIAAWRFKKWSEVRKRMKEEELARQAQAMREAALRAAEEEGVMLELSPEDKARLEMQENAINLAKEHPEEVANLIRTWMAEE